MKKEEKYFVNMGQYHTRWNYVSWKESGCIERLEELLSLIQNTDVSILIENIYSMEDRIDSAVLKIADYIDNEHLKVCLDICHLHCQANIFRDDFNKFLDNYLNKENAKKYIYQIHYAATLDNDGYIKEKETHGRRHINIEDCKEDYDILTKYELENTNIVTEVSEDDYSTRVDQIEEIKMLEEIV